MAARRNVAVLGAALALWWFGRPVCLLAQQENDQRAAAYRLLDVSRFEVWTKPAGVLRGLGDEHLIRAAVFNGQITYDPTNPSAWSVELTIPVESLNVLTPVDSSSREEIRGEMLSGAVLSADEHPEVRFVSKEVAATDNGFMIVGELTLVGQTREVIVEVSREVSAEILRVWGEFSIKQTDFGITPYGVGLGTVQVADEVTFHIDAIARRVSGGR